MRGSFSVPHSGSVELEHVEQVADRRTVKRYVGVVSRRNRVWEVVSTALGEGFQVPIPLDEFQDRNVVGIGVIDVPASRERRNDDERNPRTIAEEIQRLDV